MGREDLGDFDPYGSVSHHCTYAYMAIHQKKAKYWFLWKIGVISSCLVFNVGKIRTSLILRGCIQINRPMATTTCVGWSMTVLGKLLF